MTNRDTVAAAARPPRQAVVARPPRRGPARATTGATRWTARSSRPSAGARDVVRGRARRDRRLVSSPTRHGGGRPGPATGTPTTSASTAPAWPAGSRGRLMRVAVTGAAGRLGRALVARPSPTRRSPGRAGPLAWTRDDFDLDAPGGRRRAAGSRPARGRRPRRGLDRRRRLRARSRARAAPQRRPRPGCSPGPARSAASTSSSSRRTRCSTGADRWHRLRPDDAPAPGQPVRRLEARRRARRRARRSRRAPAGRARHRPDGLAVRAARPRLPARGSSRRPIGRRGRRAAAGRRRRVGHAHVRRRRRRGDLRAAGGRRPRRDPPSRERWCRDARRMGRRRPRPARRAGRARARPVERPGRAPRRRRAGASSRRPRSRAASPCVRGDGDGRLRADAASRDRASMSRRPRRPRVRSARRGTGRSRVRSLIRAARSASCGARAADDADQRFVQANLSSSAAGVLRGLHLPSPPARPLGRRERAGVRGPRRRPSDARAGRRRRAARRDPRARGGRLGRHPDRRGPRLPRARAARAPLPRDERVRRHATSSGSPGTTRLAAVPWPAVAATPDGRPILSDRDRRTRRSRELVARSRLTGATCAAVPAARTGPHRSPPAGSTSARRG